MIAFLFIQDIILQNTGGEKKTLKLETGKK